MTAHWGIEDPSKADGPEIERKAAFAIAPRYLKNRVAVFTALSLDRLDHVALHSGLQEIGLMEGHRP